MAKSYPFFAFLFCTALFFPSVNVLAQDAEAEAPVETPDILDAEADALVAPDPVLGANPDASVEEKKDEPRGTAGDAVTGDVPTEAEPYYDVYDRQIGYKKSAKSFRKSIEQRRLAYEKDRLNSLNTYRGGIDSIYKEESKEYQAELAREAEAAEAAMGPKTEAEAAEDAEAEAATEATEAEGTETAATGEEGLTEAAPAEETEAAAPEEAAPAEGVKEKVVEESDSEAKPRKKIIMPEDAPDF